ncbi:type VII secretion protein EccB [Streptomyces sp. NPDC021093]|uniref:type VII secretion protein EccB n=1 Tax=Streptomyces sp. NPDC021093 TaxID=3365112 RepID=UPI003789F0E7
MASRRDELNAYTFAKRRLIAQFLRPTPTGSDEHAPRPLRAVLPGVLVGVVGLAGFGAWGLFQPVAPRGWDETRAHVIIASRSTARFVVLDLDGVRRLHPVLNMSSARLLVNNGADRIVKVDDRILDESKLVRGPALGIPYAPDRLPEPASAAAPKTWAVCERPGHGGSRTVQRALFVLAGKERSALGDRRRLHGGQVLYVVDRNRVQYVVDEAGTAYRLTVDSGLLAQVVGPGRVPQQVSERWLSTLPKGGTIKFPTPEGVPGTLTRAPRVQPHYNKVGTVVVTGTAGGRRQHYLVLPDRVAPVSDLMAKLLVNNPKLAALHPQGSAIRSDGGFAPGAPFLPPGRGKWPQATSWAVNSPNPALGSRNTVCSVLRAVNSANGAATLGTWAGTGFPLPLPTGTTTVYVTPGSGQYFRQFKGTQPGTGTDYLLTDTGLRHAMQRNGDTAKGTVRPDKGAAAAAPMTAAQLLGYGRVRPALIPAAWSELVPAGPRLSTGAAQQPQGS